MRLPSGHSRYGGDRHLSRERNVCEVRVLKSRFQRSNVSVRYEDDEDEVGIAHGAEMEGLLKVPHIQVTLFFLCEGYCCERECCELDSGQYLRVFRRFFESGETGQLQGC